jgi:ABC-2 type transport system permease protein
MFRALLYLRLMSARNWVVARVRRLRQPKYLLGAIVGCAYFYFFFFRSLTRPPRPRRPDVVATEAADALQAVHAKLPADWAPVTLAFGALAFLVFLVLMWVVPARRAALGFSEAEIAFLFPAPVTRRALVHFRLLSSQLRSLLGAAVMMLFSNQWSILGGNALTHAIGWWFIFSTLNLHFSGASFTLTRLADLGLAPWRRRLLILAALVTVIGVAIARLPAEVTLPPATDLLDLRGATAWIIALTETAPLAWLLWPAQIVLGPFLAVDAAHFLRALGPALALVTLHYLWVVRSAVAFEDTSIDFAQKRSARLAAWRAGGRPPHAPSQARPGPFHLPSIGRPELAFLWKNLLSTWPYFTGRVLLGSAVVVAAGGLWLGAQPEARALHAIVGAAALMLGAYTLIVGPQFARQDIRRDLAHADVLKTYPLPGWQIILGELLAPIAILTGILWLAILAAALTFQPVGTGFAWLTPAVRIAATGGLAVIAPVLVALQLLVPNAAALLFPSWFQATRTRGGGPEVVGQRMIFFFAQLLTMVFALAPAAGLAALLIFIGQWLVGPAAAVVIATLATLAVLLGEVWCGVWLLGDRFEKLDLSAELRTTS